MKAKEWNKEHELSWSDSLALTESRRTKFQESALKALKELLEFEEIVFNIEESEVEDADSERKSSQMIKVEIKHDCIKDSYIYAKQLDFTANDQTFNFGFWGYLAPDSLIKNYIQELKKKIKNCG